jgi:hypothetical protein
VPRGGEHRQEVHGGSPPPVSGPCQGGSPSVGS